MGDFTPDRLDSRSLETLWEWKNRVLLEEYYIFNVAIPLEKVGEGPEKVQRRLEKVQRRSEEVGEGWRRSEKKSIVLQRRSEKVQRRSGKVREHLDVRFPGVPGSPGQGQFSEGSEKVREGWRRFSLEALTRPLTRPM